MSVPTYEIELTIIAAKGIKAGDVGGTSDAYIKLKGPNKQKFKTSVSAPTVNPYWDEKYTLTVAENAKLEFQLYDKDKLSKDDKLGKVTYTIPPLLNNDIIYEIKKIDTKGFLYFSIYCKSGGKPRVFHNPDPKGKVFLKISNPLARHYSFHAPDGNSSLDDTYCFKMGLLSDQTSEAKTHKVKGKAKKEYSEFSDFFIVETRVEDKLTFNLHTKYLTNTSKRVVATGKWRVPDLRDGEILDIVVSSKFYASFEMKVECLRGIYHDAYPNQIPPALDYGVTEKPRYEVTVLKGENFIQADATSNSDPYLKLKTSDSKRWRVTCVCSNAESGEWIQPFKMKAKPGDTVTIKCWDQDKHGSDPIGDTSFVIPTDMKEEERREFKLPVSVGENCNVYIRCKRMRNLTKTYLQMKGGVIAPGDPNAVINPF